MREGTVTILGETYPIRVNFRVLRAYEAKRGRFFLEFSYYSVGDLLDMLWVMLLDATPSLQDKADESEPQALTLQRLNEELQGEDIEVIQAAIRDILEPATATVDTENASEGQAEEPGDADPPARTTKRS